MSTVTSLEMRVLEENAAALGVSPLQLMESAGKSVAEVIRSRYPPPRRVLVICGLGNNGGDGFVTARYLSTMGYEVTVVLIGDPAQIRTEEARRNWRILEKLVTVRKFVVRYEEDLQVLETLLQTCDLVVDALLGTGLRGPVKGLYGRVIELVNQYSRTVVSVDVPSGLCADTGEVMGCAVKATLTITMHKPKVGLEKRRDLCGEVVVVDIGIPREAELYVGPGDVRVLVPRWRPETHKGERGWVLVVGGSRDFSGAPALTALAALRTGADVVVVVVPEVIRDVVRSFSPLLIVRSVPGEYHSPRGLKVLEELVARCTSLVVGPGLGLVDEVRDFLQELLKLCRRWRRPTVIDADALKHLQHYRDLAEGMVLTPHSGEFRILTGEVPPRDLLERCRVVEKWARELRCVLLLKGHEDVVSDGVRTKVNLTGNPGMATGGTGDVLSGVLATFLSWTTDLFRAACAAAYVTGLAGDFTAQVYGYHYTALDVVERIPEVLRKFEEVRIGVLSEYLLSPES